MIFLVAKRERRLSRRFLSLGLRWGKTSDLGLVIRQLVNDYIASAVRIDPDEPRGSARRVISRVSSHDFLATASYPS